MGTYRSADYDDEEGRGLDDVFHSFCCFVVLLFYLTAKQLCLHIPSTFPINRKVFVLCRNVDLRGRWMRFYPPVADPVPEPSTYALFGLGVFGMLMVMRRKRAA